MKIMILEKRIRWHRTLTMLALMWVSGTGMMLAQSQVTGLVSSEGETLPGVNILIKGSLVGTATDIDGSFSITASPDDILVFSFVGFETQEVQVGNRSSIEVEMTTDANALDEVVVIGYGTVKKSDVTGSVSSINTEQLQRAPTANVDQSLQGLAAGVTVTAKSGSPGSEATIRVRGFGTINNSNPYVIIDGAPGSLNGLNSADIANIEVLKDASATAIYGSNGANGVILVTTKKGKKGAPKVSIDTYYGAQKRARSLDILSAPEWAMLVNEGRANDGQDPEFANPSALETFAWGDLVYRTGIIQNHQISVSGGNDFMDYFVSYGFTDQEGIIKDTDFNRHNLRINNSYKINDNITLGHRLTYSTSFQSLEAEAGEWLWEQTAVQGYGWEPHIPFYDQYGGFSAPQRVTARHPDAKLLFEDNQLARKDFGANTYLDINLLGDFNFRSTYAFGIGSAEIYDFDEALPDGFANNGGIPRPQNQLTVRNDRSNAYTWSNVLTYNKELGANTLTALIGHEQQEREFVGATAIGRDISVLFGNPIIDNTANRDSEGRRSEESLLSFFTRATFNVGGKYLFTGTVRRDGSSKFGPNNRWGTFPAAAVAWNVHNEDFFGSSTINRLKIRGGWGIIGNRNFPDFGFFSLLSLGPTAGVDVAFAGERAPGAASKGAANPDLKWESTQTTNIGVDLGILEDKFTISIDYFNRNTSDMIINIPPPTQTSGLTNNTLFNIGKMNNKGVELGLGYNTNLGDLKMSLVGNVDIIRNTLTELNTENAFISNGQGFGQRGFLRSEPGRAISTFYGLVTDGIFQNDAEVSQGAQETAQPGDIRYVDQNNDGVINGDDRTWIGSPFPDFNYSFNIGLDYKAFDVNIFFQGTQGNDIFSSFPYFFENELNSGLARSALDRWTGPGTSTTVPRATFEGAANNIQVSDRFVFDGSYLRLKTLQIGYSLPRQTLEKYGIERFRIFVSGQNLLTFTSYDAGLDPEIGAATNEFTELRSGDVPNQLYIGHDRGTYPQARAFTVGANVTF